MRAVRSLAAIFLAQRDRWILWTPVPLALGIGVYFSLPSEPYRYLGLILLAVLVAAIAPFYRNSAVVYIWLVFFLAVLGFTASQLRTWSVYGPVLHKKSQAVLLQGRVIDVDALEKSYRVILDDLSYTGETPHKRMPSRVRIRLKKNDTGVPQEGDVIAVKAVLLPLPLPVLRGAYDMQKFSYFKKIGASGFAVEDIRVVEKQAGDFVFAGLRRSIRERIYAHDLAPKNIEGLTVAFITGDADGITTPDWDIARQSGIAHLIAISGSHFAMIVGVVFFMVRAGLAAVPPVALRWPVKKIAAGAGMAMALFYVLLIGAPISAQRAAVMSMAIMLAIMLDRDPFTLRVAALAAFVVLLATPEALGGASFQMSFAAVIGLIAFFESSRDMWSRFYQDGGLLRRIGLFLLTCFMTTVVASLAVGPFTLYHFLRDPVLAGLVANMVAVPLSSFITFPLGLLACLLMPFGLEAWPLKGMEESIAVIMRFAEFVTSWPHTTIIADAWPLGWLVAVSLGGLWICIWQGRIRWLGLVPVAGAVLMAGQAPRPDVLVGGNFRLLAAVRDDTGKLLLSPGKAEKFVRTAWIEREGGKGDGLWPEDKCGAQVCTYEIKGHTILFHADDGAATEQECGTADIIVTPKAERPAFACAATVIDKWSLYREGTHEIYLDNAPVIKTVAEWRGDRPWTRVRRRKFLRRSIPSNESL